MTTSFPFDRRTLLGSGVAGLVLAGTPCHAQPGHPSARLDDVLPALEPAHPRLLLDDTRMQACRQQAAHDPVYRQLIDRIMAEARTILAEPVVPYRLTGNDRPSMLGGSRAIIRKVLHCAFAWRWSGDRVFAERVRTELLSAAHFPEWNHTHFLDVAETAFGVAIGYDWIHAALSDEDRATIRMALVEKALLWADRAYRGSGDEWLGFPGFYWNWNQVCNGGVLAAALAVAEDEPQLVADILAGVQRSVPLALAGFAPDGAGPEGPVYWTYGITFHVLILAMLQSALGSDFALGSGAAFAQTDMYRLWVQGPTGLAFNYGDCKEQLGPTAALAWLGQHHGHAAVTALARAEMIASFAKPRLDGEFDRFFPLYALWYPQATKTPLLAQHGRRFCGHAELAIFRGDWSSMDSAYLGFKAGNNATNHAHLDLGSFVLEGQGVRWAVDLAGDSYQIPGYFDGKSSSGKRYGIFRVSTAGHGTLMPEGVGQDPFAKALIARFAERADGGFAIADLTSAYPGHARSVRRGIDFARRGARVTVRDEIDGARPGAAWRWAMFTRAAIIITGNRAVLTQDGKSMLAVIETPGMDFHELSATPSSAAENPNRGVRILAITTAADQETRAIQVALYPLGDRPGRAGVLAPLDQWEA
ncbi:heparinase II/III family protein [Novosphingobium sp. SG720]|uniref:heparinase II/III domain-containing protein n=1 Tax=Novosphingobium sp. SG720 TaxID=2586998 RepID=UPI001444A5A1|nr:heparinase II/III family protein [Novosphingobium sp. SG720]NKJ45119.1 hypothetical protein [Novosphingobium sp. SG720]